jgi:hypothetical protein
VNPELTEVLPWLYIGSAKIAREMHELISQGFTHILNATEEVEDFHTQR